jgi:hypothetical protein
LVAAAVPAAVISYVLKRVFHQNQN